MDKRSSLRILYRDYVTDCQRCELSKSRNQIVFGRGNLNPVLMVIGPSPGKEEDQKGEPFVGPSGRLLDNWLSLNLGFDRKEVYFAHLCMCKSSIDTLQPEEMSACFPFLEEQVRLIEPFVILSLGEQATQVLVKSSDRLENLRGRWFRFSERLILPTYHPNDVLKNQGLYSFVQKDFRKLSSVLAKVKHTADFA